MFGELEIFLCLALSTAFHGTDTAVVDTVNRMKEHGYVNEDHHGSLLDMVVNAPSPKAVVGLALKYYQDTPDFVEVSS